MHIVFLLPYKVPKSPHPMIFLPVFWIFSPEMIIFGISKKHMNFKMVDTSLPKSHSTKPKAGTWLYIYVILHRFFKKNELFYFTNLQQVLLQILKNHFTKSNPALLQFLNKNQGSTLSLFS